MTGFGYNVYGQSTPPATLVNVTTIEAGDSFSLAVDRFNRLTLWGNNDKGQATLPAGIGNVLAVGAGGDLPSL